MTYTLLYWTGVAGVVVGGWVMATTFDGGQVYFMALLGAALWLELRERRGA